MNKVKLWIPVLAGLMVGQLFAEGVRPFKVANTVRAGYNDNLYYNSKDEEKSFFVTDTIDLSFRAALSDRTDMTLKSQINLLTDTGDNELYPNLSALLSHSVSPRLLLRLSEYYRSGEKEVSGTTVAEKDKRYNYFQNNVDVSADYVLTVKDRLGASLNQGILRNDDEIDDLDYTTVGSGASWTRELSPQRTYATFNLRRSRVDYDNNPSDTNLVTASGATNKISYLDAQAYYNQTDLSVELSHTFNQEWQGRVEAGVTYVENNFSDSWSELVNPIDSSIINKTTNRADNASQLKPLLSAGLVYSPSPRTRLTSDLSITHEPSNDSGYGGQDTSELRFGAQHEITAKLKASATARFANTKYNEQNAITEETEEDRMAFDLRFTYKLNRINFLELGLAHNEILRDTGEDWERNTVNAGWRVELN